MKSTKKVTWLTMLEAQTELYIREAVSRFQNLDEVALSKPSITGGWSVTECLAHLNTYGNYYLPRLEQSLGRSTRHPPSDIYISSWIGRYLIRLTDPEMTQIKMKAVKRHQPNAELPPHHVVAAFIEQQETMLRLIRLAQHAEVNHFRIPLSIARWVRLPAGDILQFMVTHTKRHMIQAVKNLEHV